MVAVVVLTNEVPVLVEGKLVRVAQPHGEHLEIATVGVGSHQHTAVGILPGSAIGSLAVEAYVANAPVDTSVGSHF